MFETKFIVSECGNTPEEAWDRAIGTAHCEDYTKERPHGGILDKTGFKVIGKLQKGGNGRKAAKEIVDKHKGANTEAMNALCIDVGDGEYYFVGRSLQE